MKIKYWDNLVLMVESGYFVAIKCTSNNSFEWLTTETEGEKFILNKAKTEEATMEWDILTVPNLSEYIKKCLYFIGHLDNDMVLQSLPKVDVPQITSTDKFAKIFEKLISQPLTTAKLLVTIHATSDPSHEENTPMNIGEPKQTPPTGDTEIPLKSKPRFKNLMATQTWK